MAVTTAAVVGLAATAVAKPDSSNGRNEGHGKENHAVFKGDTHHPDVLPPPHRSDHPHSSYGQKDGRYGRHGHFDDFAFEPHKHQPYHAPDQIEAFQHFWRNTGAFAHSCVKTAWTSIASHWDDHGKGPHEPHGGYTPASYGGHDHDKPDWNKPGGDTPDKPDWNKHDKEDKTAWDKPDWDKPHNHDRPDKPGWHVPGPDCHEPPVEVPEPSSLPVLGSALLAAWLFRRRNKALRTD